ncbi:GEVED domain-containing protein [Emticicia soli]|uniref:GEVED domain-containing protein n=1 Tax=Emticicia soli TaxID=2027878 RepID=A0ABW5J612_9BACT
MKKTRPLLIVFLLFAVYSHAQKNVYHEVNLAKKTHAALKLSSLFRTPIAASNTQKALVSNNSAVEFSVNKTELKKLSQQQIPFLSLTIPASTQNAFELELIPINIYGPQFRLLNAENQEVPFVKSTHYKGVVKGDPKSLVALSVGNGEISGFISNKDGNYVLGKLKKSENYVLYNDKDLLDKKAFNCEAIEEKIAQAAEVGSCSTAPVRDTTAACNPVLIHLEADYQIFKDQDSSMVTATNFVTHLFAQVVVLYDREWINMQIAELKIWNRNEPFMSPWTATFQQVYHAFGYYIADSLGGNFNGHIAHLLSGKPLGGGMGEIDVLCSKGWSVTTSVGDTVIELPTYSRAVKVITHEIGHNLGSSHTNSCRWPCGALDNCWTIEPRPDGGRCTMSPFPEVRGTIMSYCDIGGASIDLYNGFGILPGNLIRQKVQACMGNTKPAVNLSAINVYRNTAHLLWEHPVGEGDYTIEYKPASSSTWISKATNIEGLIVTGLLSNTAYDWRVKVDCSPYTTSTFTTNNQPPVEYCKTNYTYSCDTWPVKMIAFQINDVYFSQEYECLPAGQQPFNFKPIRNLNKGQVQNFIIHPGSVGGSFVHASIWIDFNKNGSFETTDKVFVTQDSTNSGTISGSFTIPDSVVTQKYTRMRVMLTMDEKPLATCGNYITGETEDYLINIEGNCPTIVSLYNPVNNIVAGGQIIQALATGGTINATNHIDAIGTMATYQSNVINLSPGFKAEKGTIFKAETGGCN